MVHRTGESAEAVIGHPAVLTPIRLQLSRRKGFDLQLMSLAYNGRSAVNVARPSKWGNPFSVLPFRKAGSTIAYGTYIAVPTVSDAIACFEEFIDAKPEFRSAAQKELRDKNLACWCKSGEQCHADVLLRCANA